MSTCAFRPHAPAGLGASEYSRDCLLFLIPLFWSTHYGNLSCRRARALAQAATREEARATRLEGALRDARRRLAAAIARLQNKRGTYNIRTALWNKRHAAKQARRKARLAERAGVAFKPRRRARRSARAAEGVAEGVAPLRRRHNWRRTRRWR